MARSNGMQTDPITGQKADRPAEIETKEFFRTSEFWVMLLGTLAVAITALADEAFDAPGAVRLFTFLAVAYIISRGIAKAGSAHMFWGRDMHPLRGRGHESDAGDYSTLEARLAALEGRRR